MKLNKKCSCGEMATEENSTFLGIQEGPKFNLRIYNHEHCGSTVAIKTEEGEDHAE